jgi:pyruvate dehydrogenase E2 component (dihydrolipoyllysine-residue acetyltransferase)
MPTPVVMSQVGESIAEGTIVRWIKRVGDTIERDEPLFEISTDKVDSEIPAPTAGVLTEIRVKEGETVPVDSVVAMISQTGEVPSAAAHAAKEEAAEPPRSASPPSAVAAPQAAAPSAPRPQPAARPAAEPQAGPSQPAPEKVAAKAQGPEVSGSVGPPHSQRADQGVAAPGTARRSSPLVRRMASEHHVDLSQVTGTGIGGRVTKRDMLEHLGLGHPDESTQAPASGQPAPATGPKVKPGENVEIVPMSAMRRKIAEHMTLSRRTSAHVHSVFEVNFTSIAQLREAKKAEYEREGAKLTYMSFIARAVADAIRAVPIVNASVDGDNIVYKRDVNLGIAVALDWGLIVPVIKGAHEKNLVGLSKAITDLAVRARAKKLSPEDVQGGTFTITNPGVFGALFGMPIINQPQVAILGVGAVEKRPVVIGDAIGIRRMAYLTLGYDHRIIDGAVADQFMARLKELLENFADE